MKQQINIGVEGNDGTGDSIRGAFTKVNENFEELYSAFGIEGAISFSDLADGPIIVNGSAYSADQLIMANSTGDRLIARSVIGGDNIQVSITDTGELKISAPATQISSDSTPNLAYPFNASSNPIGNLPYPDQAAVDLFNTTWGDLGSPTTIADLPVTVRYANENFLSVYNGTIGYKDASGNVVQPSLASAPTQVDTTSVDYDPELTGNYLTTSLVPRKDLVYRGGDTMTGPLLLSDHPAPLEGFTSSDPVDLQAATRYYVDNKTFSSNVNLYVSASSGDDLQTNTPAGKEGRFWNYSYNTIGSALLHAQSLIDLASQEPGPYKQRISYSKNADLYFSTIKKVSLTGGNSIGTNSEGYIAAYDLLQANRAFIQAETIAYINKKYVNAYSYTESELKIKVNKLITAVADDLMLGSITVNDDDYRLNYKSYWNAIEYLKTHTDSNELIQWKSVIEFVKTQIIDFSYNVANLQTYTASIVNALCYDFLFDSNYQSLQTAIAFNNATTGITPEQLSAMITVNPIEIQSASYTGNKLTIAFDTQLINNFPVGSKIVVNGIFTRGTTVVNLNNIVALVDSSTTSSITIVNSSFTITGTYAVTNNTEYAIPYFDRFNLINQILLIDEVRNNSSISTLIATNAALIASIVDGGIMPDVVMPVLSNTPALYDKIGYSNAKDLLLANIPFIQSEVIAYLSAEFPLATYDRALCIRDVKYAVRSIAYDVMYGGNSQTVYSATQIKKFINDQASVSTVSSDACKSAMAYINTLAQSIIQNIPLATIYQQSVKQYRNNSLTGGVIASTSISTNVDTLVRIVSLLPSTPANVTLSISAAGAITASAAISTIAVGQAVEISGTNTGTGTITAGTYYVIATNGTSTFQLSTTYNGLGVVTGAGTLIGLSYKFMPYNMYANATRNTISNTIKTFIPLYTVTTDLNESDGYATTTTPWFIDHFYPVINDDDTKTRIEKLFDFISTVVTVGSYPTALPVYPSTIASIYTNVTAVELQDARIAINTGLTDIVDAVYDARSAYKVSDVSTELYKQYVKDVVLAVEYDITYGGSSATFAASSYLGKVDVSPTSLLSEIKIGVKSAVNVALKVLTITNGTQFTVNIPHETTGDVVFVMGSKTGLEASITANVATVTLTTGNTTDISVGDLIIKTSGTGEFGTKPISILIDNAFSTTNNPAAITTFQDIVPYKAATSLRNIMISNSPIIETDTVSYVKSNFSGGFKYNETLCYRDIGSIINALSIDLITAGTWQSVNAGKSFYKNASGILVASGAQRVQSLDGIDFVKDLALQVLNKKYQTRYQSLVTQISSITNAANLPSTLINVGRSDDTRVNLTVSPLAITDFTTNINSMISIVRNGIGNAPIMVTSMFGTGVWHVAVDNGNNGYVDQGKPNNIDLFPAKIILGVGKQSTSVAASTATASIVKYVGGQDTALTIVSVEDATHFTVSIPHKTSGFITFAVGTTSGLGATLVAGSRTVTLSVGTVSSLNIGQTPAKTTDVGEFGSEPLASVDTIQVQLIRPEFFNLNEEVEFGETVRDLHITMFIESGIYYEDYPLKISPNISIRGDEFRRTIIRPKDRVSQSPWRKVFFYRDAVIDALEVGVIDYNGTNYAPADVSASFSAVTSKITVTLTTLDSTGKTVPYQASLSWIGKVIADNNTVNGNAKRGKAVVDSVSGNLLNCTAIYPFDGVARVFEPTEWKLFSTKNYGYHYLTDPSDPTSQAKNNKDIDVFLCNEGNRIVGITFQGQGGFGMVLDPAGNIKTKSPYIQECSSFSQSNNYKRFAGGQYIDGFAGRLRGEITQVKDNGITVYVTGDASSGLHIRPPQAPCSFYVRGKRYQIDDVKEWTTVIDSQTGLATSGTAVLILDKTTTYLYDPTSQAIVFNLQKTRRDTRYVIDAAAADLALGTNYRSVHAGRRFLASYSSALVGSLQDLTVAGINRAASQTTLASNSTFMSNIGIMTSMLLGGKTAEPTIYWTDLTSGDDYANKNLARNIIQKNRSFIINEISAYIAETEVLSNYPKYNVLTSERDIGYIVDAITYDLVYGGTSQTYSSAVAFYNENVSYVPSVWNICVNTFNRLKTIMPYLVTNQTTWGVLAKSAGNSLTQDTTLTPSGINFQTKFDSLFNILLDYIEDGAFTPSSSQHCKAISATISGTQTGTYVVGDLLTVTGTTVVAYVSEVSLTGSVVAVDFLGPNANAGDFTSPQSLSAKATVNSNVAVGHGTGVLLTIFIGPEVFPTISNATYTTAMAYSNIHTIAENVVTYLSNGANQQINIEMGGNRSMLGNDFAMFNDLAYGILANNGAFTEQVCTFTYYAHTGFWANNGSNLRGVGCSNSFGNYGLRASGYDVTELPDSVSLANNMIQTARIYKQGETINKMAPTATNPATELWIIGYDYIPTNGSVLEIDHSVNGEGIISYIISSVQYTSIQVGTAIVIKLSLSSSGDNGTSSTGLKTSLYNGQLVTIHSTNSFKFNNIDNVRPTRPSTALQYNDNLNSVYRVVGYNLSEATGDTLPDNTAILQSDNAFLYYSLSTDTSNVVNPDPNSGIYATIVTGSKSSTTITVNNLSPSTLIVAGQYVSGIGFDLHTVVSVTGPVSGVYTVQLSANPITTPYGIISFSTKTQGASVGDTRIAVNSISSVSSIDQINRGTYVTAWNGRLHRVTKYIQNSIAATGVLELWTPGTNTLIVTNVIGTIVDDSVIVGRTSADETIEFTGVVSSSTYNKLTGKSTVIVDAATLVGVSSLTPNDVFTFGVTSNSAIEISPNAIINNNTIGSPVPALVYKSKTSFSSESTIQFVTFDIPYSKNNVLPVVNSYVSVANTTNALYNGSYQVTSVTDQTAITIGSTADYSVGMVVTFQLFVTDITGGKTFKATTAHSLVVGDIVTFKETNATYGVDSSVSYYVKTVTATNGVYDKFTVSLTSGGAEKTNFVNSTGLLLEINTPISNMSHMNTATNNSIVQEIIGNTLIVSPACWAPVGAPVRSTVAAIVDSIVIEKAGSGYTSAPNLRIDGGSPTTFATATCTVSNGSINQVTIVIKGSGYITQPSVVILPSIDTDTAALEYSEASLRIVLSTPVYKDSTSTAGVTTSTVTLMYPTDPETFDSNEVKIIASSTKTTGNSYAGTNAGITYTASAGYLVTLAINTTSPNTAFTSAPTAGSWYKISGNSNGLYNGVVQVVSAGTTSSVTVFYPYDPGTAGTFTGDTTSISKTTSNATSSSLGISKPFSTTTSYTMSIGYPSSVGGQVTTRISTCRATGHDFCDIGTGGYSTTNIPYSIYGEPSLSRQVSHETLDEGVGRCFYVSTNQDGIFRVGRFFSVDQGTGIVTLSSKTALSNIAAFGFSGGGAVVSEFSTDSTLTDNSSNKVPVESSVRGYIDKRLGLDHGGSQIPSTSAIGPGYLPLSGIVAMTGNLKMANHAIVGLQYPGSDTTAAANVAYVDARVNSKSNVNQLSDVTISTPTTSQLLVFDGTSTSTWVNKTLIGDITVAYDSTASTLTATIGSNKIVNSMISSSAAIEQSKLSLTAASTRANATSIAQANLGVASFNDKVFVSTSGWIDLADSTSITTGVLLDKLQFIPTKTLLGNLSSASAHVTTVTPGAIVTDGDGIKNASFTSQGAMSVASITTGVNAYSVVPYTTTGAINSIVQTDGSGAVDAQQLKIDGKKAIDTTSASSSIQLYTPSEVSFLSATGTSEATTVVSVTTLETTSRSGKVQTTTLTTGAAGTAGTVIGNWTVSSGSRWNLTDAVTELSADGLYASSARVNIRPSLILDFANSKTLDPRVTFTRASIASYYNAQGVLVFAGTNQPRFDHDLSGISKGLLIEESRINLLKYSTTFTTGTGNWTQTNFSSTSVVANGAPTRGSAIQFTSAVAFDGTLSTQLSGISTTLPYVFTIWAKLVSGTATVSLSLDGTNWKTMNVTSTLTRYTFPEISSSSAAPTLSIKVPMNSSIILWGAQFEQVRSGGTGFATSYIKTDWETTSSTSNSIATGTKTFIVVANGNNTVEKIPDNASITITATAGNTLVGTITSHVGTTLTVSVASVTGSGTFTSWTMQAGIPQMRALEYASLTGTNFSNWYRPDEGTIIVNATIVSTRTGDYSTVKLQSPTDSNSIVLGCTAASNVLTFNSSSNTISFTGYTDTDTIISVITASTAPASVTDGFAVTFTINSVTTAPTVNSYYKVVGNSNPLYNGVWQVTASTTTSVTLFYPTNTPGTYSTTGTTFIVPVKSAVTHGISYKADNCIYGYNGNAVQTDTTATIDSDISSLVIGNSTAGIGVQYIARITYYPLGISGSEMQRMTTQ
jgi:hypothetical protein